MYTNEVAKALGLQSETLRKAVARTGSYYGVTPIKLRNGRLLWPADSVARLKGGAQ